ncbi:MAG TPA: hypothetical protein V6D08_02240 [Candidatus Obscuribacterales bacterium]
MPASRSNEPAKSPEHSGGGNPKPATGASTDIPEIDDLLARLDKRDVHELNQAPVRGVVSDYGQIHSIDLPPGWIESTEKFVSGVGTRSLRMFHPPEAPSAALCFYYRGLRITAQDGEHFRRLLHEPAHRLTDQEVSSVGLVLRDKSAPAEFTISNARTEDINKKRVLIVEGTYTRLQQDVFHIFLDSDGTGTAVQEIYFQAPSELYLNYLTDAKAALYSIEWR